MTRMGRGGADYFKIFYCLTRLSEIKKRVRFEIDLHAFLIAFNKLFKKFPINRIVWILENLLLLASNELTNL